MARWRSGVCLRALAVVAAGLSSITAEALQDQLRANNIPTAEFDAFELERTITSYAVSGGAIFLLAYYEDNGSGFLAAPLRIVRYDREHAKLSRVDLRATDRPAYSAEIVGECFGSALSVREERGWIYVGTHINPSAGCLFVLTPRLEWKAALPGWLLGVLGGDYAIWRHNETHFMSVHPLHVEVFDLKTNRVAELYPYAGDRLRAEFSALIRPGISGKWCMEHNAQCDPGNFDVEMNGAVVTNEAACAFAFEARFDAGGFGDAVESAVAPSDVTYVFRQCDGQWVHREFNHREFQVQFKGTKLDELITRRIDLVFPPSPAR